jgi:hypothetical protein
LFELRKPLISVSLDCGIRYISCRNYKFDNIVVPNGQFSVHYLFPDVGLFEVITRISAKDIAALAPFKVVVPMQPIPP